MGEVNRCVQWKKINMYCKEMNPNRCCHRGSLSMSRLIRSLTSGSPSRSKLTSCLAKESSYRLRLTTSQVDNGFREERPLNKGNTRGKVSQQRKSQRQDLLAREVLGVGFLGKMRKLWKCGYWKFQPLCCPLLP